MSPSAQAEVARVVGPDRKYGEWAELSTNANVDLREVHGAFRGKTNFQQRPLSRQAPNRSVAHGQIGRVLRVPRWDTHAD